QLLLVLRWRHLVSVAHVGIRILIPVVGRIVLIFDHLLPSPPLRTSHPLGPPPFISRAVTEMAVILRNLNTRIRVVQLPVRRPLSIEDRLLRSNPKPNAASSNISGGL